MNIQLQLQLGGTSLIRECIKEAREEVTRAPVSCGWGGVVLMVTGLEDPKLLCVGTCGLFEVMGWSPGPPDARGAVSLHPSDSRLGPAWC